ncbi:MAG: hypothetical protein IKZ54_03855 [Bacteroidales bacterium]|nr:hypothetical protein [Bacteroidales bacterium]
MGDNLHPLSPLKTLFRGKFALRNEYLLESVQVVLFRIGAKTIIFRKLSARSAPIICIFCNDLSRFLARAPHLRQHFHQLGLGQKNAEEILKMAKSIDFFRSKFVVSVYILTRYVI